MFTKSGFLLFWSLLNRGLTVSKRKKELFLIKSFSFASIEIEPSIWQIILTPLLNFFQKSRHLQASMTVLQPRRVQIQGSSVLFHFVLMEKSDKAVSQVITIWIYQGYLMGGIRTVATGAIAPVDFHKLSVVKKILKIRQDLTEVVCYIFESH